MCPTELRRPIWGKARSASGRLKVDSFGWPISDPQGRLSLVIHPAPKTRPTSRQEYCVSSRRMWFQPTVDNRWEVIGFLVNIVQKALPSPVPHRADNQVAIRQLVNESPRLRTHAFPSPTYFAQVRIRLLDLTCQLRRLTTIVTTRASYRRRVRRERFEWPPEDCIPGSPWTGDSWRFCNRLRRTFGCGSIRRLSA